MPLTENLPKPMLQVDGKPMLEHIILNAKEQGFSNFIISLHYLGSMIVDHFGDGSKFQVSIKYIEEEEPLGTAGALSLLKPAPKLPFIVINGDILTAINYLNLLDFHSTHLADATMAIKKYELQNPYGVVHTEGFEISSFQEKPVQISYVNAGIYAISPSTLQYIVDGSACDMPDFLMKLKRKDCLVTAYPVYETWADVGRPIDLSEINSENSKE
jgi:NDP-sugar pyrophosphorylase family protein